MALVAAAAAAENFLQSVASYAAVEVAVDLVSTPAVAGVRFPGISNGILDMTLFSIILQAALLGVCYISAKVVLVSGDAPMVRVKCFIANIASSSSPYPSLAIALLLPFSGRRGLGYYYSPK